MKKKPNKQTNKQKNKQQNNPVTFIPWQTWHKSRKVLADNVTGNWERGKMWRNALLAFRTVKMAAISWPYFFSLFMLSVGELG